MKKIIVLLAVVLLVPGFALAESVNIYDAGGGNKLIYRTDDNGETRSSNVYKVSDNTYIEFDDRGNSRLINDFSTDNDGWGDRKDRD